MVQMCSKGGNPWNGVTSSRTIPSIKNFGIQVKWIGSIQTLHSVRIKYFYTGGTQKEGRKIKTFVTDVKVQAIGHIGMGAAYYGTVFVVNNPIVINIDKTNVTGYSSWLSGMPIYISLGLKKSICFPAIECRNRVTFKCS